MIKRSPWTAEDLTRLRELTERRAPADSIARELGRSADAVELRQHRDRQCRAVLIADAPAVPAFGRSLFGPKRWWTRERIVAGLRDFAKRNKGPLPTNDHDYSVTKKSHMEWPTATRVLEAFGSMAAAWEAIGAPKSRYSRGWTTWSVADDTFLLEHAGEETLKLIAQRLNRTWPACKRRLYDLKAGPARDVAGYLSAMQVSVEYNCPLSRVEALIRSGELKAFKVRGGHYWRIDPLDCDAIRDRLSAPKTRSHRTTPVADPNYDRAYGLRRVRGADGRVIRVPAVAAG